MLCRVTTHDGVYRLSYSKTDLRTCLRQPRTSTLAIVQLFTRQRQSSKGILLRDSLHYSEATTFSRCYRLRNASRGRRWTVFVPRNGCILWTSNMSNGSECWGRADGHIWALWNCMSLYLQCGLLKALLCNADMQSPASTSLILRCVHEEL